MGKELLVMMSRLFTNEYNRTLTGDALLKKIDLLRRAEFLKKEEYL